jgi:hypothetical protein
MWIIAAEHDNGDADLVTLHRQAQPFMQRFREGVPGLLADPLERAKAAGRIRADLAPADIQRAILMVAGGGLASYGVDIQASIQELWSC